MICTDIDRTGYGLWKVTTVDPRFLNTVTLHRKNKKEYEEHVRTEALNKLTDEEKRVLGLD